MLGKAYHETLGENLPFWFSDKLKLENEYTKKSEAKKGIDKIPLSPPTVKIENLRLENADCGPAELV